MIKIKDTEFLYATSRLRYLETKFIGHKDLIKMIDAKSVDEAYKVLSDSGIGTAYTYKDFEKALNENLLEAYNLVSSVCPIENLFDIFRYKYDGHNIKTLIKSHKLGNVSTSILTHLGNVPAETLEIAYDNNDFSILTPILADSANEAKEALAKSNDPQIVDIIIDNGVLEAMYNKAMEYDSEFLHKIVRSQIDIANIRSIIRIKRIDKDLAFLKSVLVRGGYINIDKFTSVYSKSIDDIISVIKSSDYGKYLEPSFELLKTNGRLTLFEKLCDNYMVFLIKQSKLVPFGLEPLVTFILAKESEIQSIRIVLTSKLGGVSPNLITERLRETYA